MNTDDTVCAGVFVRALFGKHRNTLFLENIEIQSTRHAWKFDVQVPTMRVQLANIAMQRIGKIMIQP